ncbi:hypothetical protein ACFE04_025330 [Oxalis oulophora]
MTDNNNASSSSASSSSDVGTRRQCPHREPETFWTLCRRLETVKCKSFYGGLKIVGMIAAVGGAMVLSFNRSPSKNLHISSPEGSSLVNESGDTKNDILGPILMFIAAVTFSLWLVLQAKVLEIYPARLRFNTLQWLFSTLQTGAAASAFERNIDSWKIGWNIQLAFLVYAVVGVSGIQYVLQAWCVEKKGPFYVAMFYPLGLLITVIFSRFAWNERLSIGSMIGAIVITGGLYCVLWGRSKEVIVVGTMLISKAALNDGMNL